MDITGILSELRTELKATEEAIMAVERFARGSGKRRGRPPKWISAIKEPLGAKSIPAKKRAVSDEGRARISAAQRRRWAAAREKSDSNS
jgi:hypothetical protein